LQASNSLSFANLIVSWISVSPAFSGVSPVSSLGSDSSYSSSSSFALSASSVEALSALLLWYMLMNFFKKV